jgi:glucose/arabinose dehydrogenase
MKKLLIVLLLSLPVLIKAQNYIVETPLTGLNQPVAFDFIPNTTNVIVTHKLSNAAIYNLATNTLVSNFWTFTDSLNSGFERGVLGVTVDPSYASNNYIYIYYIHSNPPNSSTNQRSRVVRFTNSGNTGTSPLIVFDYLLGTIAGNHVGGNIRFGRDGKLYISLGETAVSSNSQLLTNPRGKLLRINSNGTIPTDNPYYDDGNPATGNDDRIWVWGLRNTFDFCVSPVNDSIYASENGGNSFDEVNFIRKGRNYGWPVCEGYCNPYNPSYRQPMHVWPSPLPAVTGIMIYQGSQMPWLNGRLLVSDNDNGRIYLCTLSNTLDSVVTRTQIFDLDGLTTLKQGTDGFIYAMNGGYTASGKIYRIKPDPSGINNNGIPYTFSLEQNYPNPFNPGTTIKYSLIKQGFVTIKIFDALGNEATVLVNSSTPAGDYEVTWQAEGFASGIYFYKMEVDGQSVEKKMVLLK